MVVVGRTCVIGHRNLPYKANLKILEEILLHILLNIMNTVYFVAKFIAGFMNINIIYNIISFL